MSWDSLLLDLGYAGFAGFVVGFAVRRVVNLFFLLLGLYLLSLMWLSSKGIVEVNWSELFKLIRGSFDSFSQFIQGLLGGFAFAGSFAVGFTIGFRT